MDREATGWAVGYDHETSTLEIEFCDSSIYQYAPVSEEIQRPYEFARPNLNKLI